MPHNPRTRARKNTVKAPLTPQTPGDWLLTRFEQQLRECRQDGGIYDGDGDRTVYIQPMFTFKALIPPDPDERMDIGADDYDDQPRRWL